MRFKSLAVLFLLVPALAWAGNAPRVIVGDKSPETVAKTDLVMAQILLGTQKTIGYSWEELYQRGYRMSLFEFADGAYDVVYSRADQLRPYATGGEQLNLPADPKQATNSYVVPFDSFLLEVRRTSKDGFLVVSLSEKSFVGTATSHSHDSRIVRVTYY